MGAESEAFGFDSEMVQEVVTDSLELLDAVVPLLQALECRPDDISLINEIFRNFHTVKGNSGMVGLKGVTQFAHHAEDGLNQLRTGALKTTKKRVEVLIHATDALQSLIGGINMKTGAEPFGPAEEACLRALAEAFSGEEESPFSVVARWAEESQEDASWAVHPKTIELQELIARLSGESEAEESEAPQPLDSAVDDTPPETQKPTAAREFQPFAVNLKVDIADFDTVMMLAGELYSIDERLKFWIHEQVQVNTGSVSSGNLRGIARDFDAVMDRLYEQIHKIRMVSAQQLTKPLERLVRDFCWTSEKKIRLVVKGEGGKLDKRIIEILHGPLVHMIRNSVDHGVETPSVRLKAGKGGEATIQLNLSEGEETIRVEIKDDGAGIRLDAVKAKAIKQGLITADQAAALSTSEQIELIYHPGLSTKEEASALSGRGVGMDVVLSTLRREGGTIQGQTEEGVGTTFLIEVPKLGSPVVEGLAARIGRVIYMLPMKSVDHFIPWKDIETFHLPTGERVADLVEGCISVVELDGLVMPGSENVSTPSMIGGGTGILLQDRRGARFILRVDDIIGWQKALVIPTGAWLEGDSLMDGAFVLGNGAIGFMVAPDKLNECLMYREAV